MKKKRAVYVFIDLWAWRVFSQVFLSLLVSSSVLMACWRPGHCPKFQFEVVFEVLFFREHSLAILPGCLRIHNSTSQTSLHTVNNLTDFPPLIFSHYFVICCEIVREIKISFHILNYHHYTLIWCTLFFIRGSDRCERVCEIKIRREKLNVPLIFFMLFRHLTLDLYCEIERLKEKRREKWNV